VFGSKWTRVAIVTKFLDRPLETLNLGERSVVQLRSDTQETIFGFETLGRNCYRPSRQVGDSLMGRPIATEGNS